MTFNKKIFTVLISLLIIMGLAGNALAAPTKKAPAKKPPLKIGVPLPFSGVYTALGNHIVQGMQLYFAQNGNKIQGRSVVIIKEDDQSKPDVGLQKVRKMVESDKVDLLAGIVASPVAYAVRDYVTAKKVPLIIANATGYDLTRGKGSPYIFRSGASASGQYEAMMAPYAYRTMHMKKVVVIAPDYAAGHEKIGEFITAFKKEGGQIIQEIWPKLGTNDFGPYLSQIKPSDGVFAFFAGSDAIAFVKQYKEFGLKDKYRLMSSGDMVGESFLKAQGDAALGIISALHYSPVLNNPVNKKFVAAYKAKYGEVPDSFAEQGYVAAQVIAEALKVTKGDTKDKAKLLKAIQNVKFDAPQGSFKFSKYRNVIHTTYIRKVTKAANGELQNSVIATYPNTVDNYYGPVVMK